MNEKDFQTIKENYIKICEGVLEEYKEDLKEALESKRVIRHYAIKEFEGLLKSTIAIRLGWEWTDELYKTIETYLNKLDEE